MQPKILLSVRAKAENYIDAVRFAGGDPVVDDGVLDPAGFEALILCGGGDIEPHRYSRESDPHVYGVDPDLDRREWELLDSFTKEKKPVLGICRGIQVINVYFGGTLIQHLIQSDRHRDPEGKTDRIHATTAEKGSFIHAIYRDAFTVNSAHHQAIDALGAGLSVAQVSADGVIEAVSHASLPVWGVQWHPERMRGKFARPDTVSGDPVFSFFLSRIKY